MPTEAVPELQGSETSSSSTPTASATPEPSSDASNTSHTVTVDLTKVRASNGTRISGLWYRTRHRTQLAGQNKISWLFDHGADCEDATGTRWWVCKYCHYEGRFRDGVYKFTGTHAAESHLRQVHKVYNPKKPLAEPLANRMAAGTLHDFFGLSPGRSTTSSPSSSYSTIAAPFADRRFKQIFVDAVVKLDLTFRQAASYELRQLILSGGPAAYPVLSTHHSGVASWIKHSFEDRRTRVKEMVLNAKSKINFSADVWTADEGNKRAYLAVNAHFLDHNGAIRTALLSFIRLLGSHSGENLGKALASALATYSIESSQIGAFVLGNASSNNDMLEELSQHYTIDLPACRLRCIGHIINLIVKAVIFGDGVKKFEKELASESNNGDEGDDTVLQIWADAGPVGKLHNISVFVNRSDQRRAAFAEHQVPLERALDDDPDPDGGDDVFCYVLLVDQGVRWSSVYYMIKRGKF